MRVRCEAMSAQCMSLLVWEPSLEAIHSPFPWHLTRPLNQNLGKVRVSKRKWVQILDVHMKCSYVKNVYGNPSDCHICSSGKSALNSILENRRQSENSYGNPGNCCPFSCTVKSRFTMWKWMAITRFPISYALHFIHSWSALIFFRGLLLCPIFCSTAACPSSLFPSHSHRDDVTARPYGKILDFHAENFYYSLLFTIYCP